MLKPPYSLAIVPSKLVYPYPFAGMSSQGIWWEDILLPGKVRYHSKSRLAEQFGVQDTAKPTFAFLRRGSSLDDPAELLSTTNYDEFSLWAWKRLEVEVTFVNHHNHDVTIWWINGRSGKQITTIPPGMESKQTTMLTHEWFARDSRVVDMRLHPDASLGSWKIVSDTETVFPIRTRKCVDMNGECSTWASLGECRNNPGYMHTGCRRSCKICSDDEEDINATGNQQGNRAKDEL